MTSNTDKPATPKASRPAFGPHHTPSAAITRPEVVAHNGDYKFVVHVQGKMPCEAANDHHTNTDTKPLMLSVSRRYICYAPNYVQATLIAMSRADAEQITRADVVSITQTPYNIENKLHNTERTERGITPNGWHIASATITD